MASFVTYKTLRTLSSRIPNEKAYLDSRKSSNYFSTFLSYSSKDSEFLPGVVRIIENHGGTIYIDNGDVSLPNPPNIETARILKSNIQKAQRFVLFVSTNSKSSKWIPWELALGDGLLNTSSVALLPSAEIKSEQDWADQEYLGLYQRIVLGGTREDPSIRWIVHDQHQNKATNLRDWLSRS